MSFIEMPGLDSAKEKSVAPEGLYDLCITSAKVTEKDGKRNIQTILEIEGGEEDYANVFHYISLVGPDDDKEKAEFKNLLAKRFFYQFGIPMEGGVEMEQFVGCRATACRLTQEEYEGRLSNKLQVNSLPQED